MCVHDTVKTPKNPFGPCKMRAFKNVNTAVSHFIQSQTSPLPSSITVHSLLPPSASPLFFQNYPIPPLPSLYFVLSLNADIIYQRSSSRLISQHKSLSPVHPSLTLHPGLYSPPSSLPPKSFHPVSLFVASHSVCDE